MVSRVDLTEVLKQWVDGARSPEEVLIWSHSDDAAGAPPDDLVRDVMDMLRALPAELVLAEDAQVMLEALEGPVEEADLGVNLLWNYWDMRDVPQRRRDLAEDPFYGPYCAGD